jgi:lysozyme
MEVSKEGIAHLKKVESFRNNPYLDTSDVPTIGFGFTYYTNGKRVTMQDSPITLKEGLAMLKVIMKDFENAVNRLVTSNINQNQFDALVSFSYNIGEGAFNESTLLERVNINPNDPSIEEQFKRWKYSGGRISNGLIRRRKQEIYLYFKL